MSLAPHIHAQRPAQDSAGTSSSWSYILRPRKSAHVLRSVQPALPPAQSHLPSSKASIKLGPPFLGRGAEQLVTRVAKQPGPVLKTFEGQDGKRRLPTSLDIPPSVRSASSPAPCITPEVPQSAPVHIARFLDREKTSSRRRTLPSRAPAFTPLLHGDQYDKSLPCDPALITEGGENPARRHSASENVSPTTPGSSSINTLLYPKGPSLLSPSPSYDNLAASISMASFESHPTKSFPRSAVAESTVSITMREGDSEALLLEDVFSLLQPSSSYDALLFNAMSPSMGSISSDQSWDWFAQDYLSFLSLEQPEPPLINPASSSDALGAILGAEINRGRHHGSRSVSAPSIVITVPESDEADGVVEGDELRFVLDLFPMPPTVLSYDSETQESVGSHLHSSRTHYALAV